MSWKCRQKTDGNACLESQRGIRDEKVKELSFRGDGVCDQNGWQPVLIKNIVRGGVMDAGSICKQARFPSTGCSD